MTASLAVRLVITRQNVVHYVLNQIGKFVMLLRKETKDSLTRQGMQNTRGLHIKDLAKGEERNEYFFLREHSNKSCQCKKNSFHFAKQHKSTSMSMFAAPKGGFHSVSVCTQPKPACIPQIMLIKVKV